MKEVSELAFVLPTYTQIMKKLGCGMLIFIVKNIELRKIIKI